MTAALKPVIQSRRSQTLVPVPPLDRPGNMQVAQFPSRVEALKRQSNSQISPAKPVARPTASVRSLPNLQATPGWLKGLLWVQRGTTATAFLSITAAFAVYGWTVYTQQLWGKEYRRLEKLQQQERQLIAADEMLKNQMAQQAELPESRLVPATTENTLFLQAPSQHLAPPLAPTATPEAASNLNMLPARPLGY